MQEAIREGALRLMTSEATCDVILNCQGHRLMAHKVMLSIASPLLQELLLADCSETSLLVLPDITASTMAYILDYMYTGSVLLHSAALPEFLSAANLLKLKIEHDPTLPQVTDNQRKPKPCETPQNFPKNYYSKFSPSYEPYSKTLIDCDYKKPVTNNCGPQCFNLTTVYSSNAFGNKNIPASEEKPSEFKRLKFSPIILQDERNPNLINGAQFQEPPGLITPGSTFKTGEIAPGPLAGNLDLTGQKDVNGTRRKTTRKVPNLMPISRCQFSAFKARKGLYNRVFPSPWCPRIVPVTGDPRNDCLRSLSTTLANGSYPAMESAKENIDVSEDPNDNNNNLKRLPYSPLNTINNASPIDKTNPTFRTVDPAVLNLHATFKDNNTISYDSNYASNTPHIDSTNFLASNHKRPGNNNYPVYDQNTVPTDIKLDTKLTQLEKKIDSDYQTVPVAFPGQKRAADSVFSSAESNSSCGDSNAVCAEGKGGEEGSKVDRSDEDNGKEEVETDQKQKPYKCEDCGKQFSQLRNYKYHRSVHEGTKEFAARCPECGKVFNDRGYLSSHLKIHRDRKEYGCPHCPKRFNQRVAYNMHLRIHTGVKPHVCPTCGKGFSRKMLLKQHQRVHTGERPYQCPECGKSFADRSNMSLHARLHTGVKPYACSLCPKSFTKKHHLKTHMNYHTGLKPYVCQKCGLTFSQSSNMRTHYKKCIQKDNNEANNPITLN